MYLIVRFRRLVLRNLRKQFHFPLSLAHDLHALPGPLSTQWPSRSPSFEHKKSFSISASVVTPKDLITGPSIDVFSRKRGSKKCGFCALS
jgi:hypothetical protein